MSHPKQHLVHLLLKIFLHGSIVIIEPGVKVRWAVRLEMKSGIIDRSFCEIKDTSDRVVAHRPLLLSLLEDFILVNKSFLDIDMLRAAENAL